MARRKVGTDLMTSGEVAEAAGVAPRTVCKWHDSGQLRGFRIPGSLDRRFKRLDVEAFFKAHGVPCDRLGTGPFRVLALGVGAAELALPDSMAVECPASLFDAGAVAATWRPDAAVIDLSVGRAEAMQAVRFLTGHLDGRAAPYVVGLVYEDETAQKHLLANGFDRLFTRPLDPGRLAEALQEQAVRKGRGR